MQWKPYLSPTVYFVCILNSVADNDLNSVRQPPYSEACLVMKGHEHMISLPCQPKSTSDPLAYACRYIAKMHARLKKKKQRIDSLTKAKRSQDGKVFIMEEKVWMHSESTSSNVTFLVPPHLYRKGG